MTTQKEIVEAATALSFMQHAPSVYRYAVLTAKVVAAARAVVDIAYEGDYPEMEAAVKALDAEFPQ